MVIGDGIIPPILNKSIYDHICIITDEEALSTAKELGRKEGIACGISSGTNVAAAIKLARILVFLLYTSTIPKVFAAMGTGRIIGILFFMLVMFAALTSAISIMEAGVATFVDQTGKSRISVSYTHLS